MSGLREKREKRKKLLGDELGGDELSKEEKEKWDKYLMGLLCEVIEMEERGEIVYPSLSEEGEKSLNQCNLKLEQLEFLVHDFLYCIQEDYDMDSKEEYPYPVLIKIHDKLEEIGAKRKEYMADMGY